MGRYVGNDWHEELPSSGPEDQQQGNQEPVPSSSGGGGGGGGGGGSSGGGGGGGGAAIGGNVYMTVNGPRTVEQMAAELRAVGWNNPSNNPEVVAGVYQSTTNAPVSNTYTPDYTRNDNQPLGSPVVGQTAATGTRQTQGGLTRAEMEEALRKFYGETAGFSREELAEKVRQFNENMAAVERQWEREGKSRLQIDIDAQALRKWQAEQDIALQQQKLAQEGELSRGRLGLDYLTEASKLGGPADYFQQQDFLRGARQRADVPVFLNALAANSQLPSFAGAGTGGVTPQTAQGLAGQLTGQPSTQSIGGYNADQALQQIASIFQRGATGTTPGTLERYDPNELDLLRSGGKKLGYDVDAWLRTYQKAGIGQQAGRAA